MAKSNSVPATRRGQAYRRRRKNQAASSFRILPRKTSQAKSPPSARAAATGRQADPDRSQGQTVCCSANGRFRGQARRRTPDHEGVRHHGYVKASTYHPGPKREAFCSRQCKTITRQPTAPIISGSSNGSQGRKFPETRDRMRGVDILASTVKVTLGRRAATSSSTGVWLHLPGRRRISRGINSGQVRTWARRCCAKCLKITYRR